MNSHRITIITSVFDAGDLLEPFIENVLQQSVFYDCLWYLVCCNDSLTHSDELICHNLAAEYPDNVRFYHLNPDPGIYGVWNYVVKQCDTEYITNANVDDRLHPKCIERHVQVLDENPDIDLTYCYNKCSFDTNKSFDDIPDYARYPTAEFSPKAMLRGNLPHNHPVWRKSLHDRFGFFDTSLFSAADWEFWLRCVVGGAKFRLIPETLGLYYWNPGGISTNPETVIEKRIEENNVLKQYQALIQ